MHCSASENDLSISSVLILTENQHPYFTEGNCLTLRQTSCAVNKSEQLLSRPRLASSAS